MERGLCQLLAASSPPSMVTSAGKSNVENEAATTASRRARGDGAT
jgi:hypothetical protein